MKTLDLLRFEAKRIAKRYYIIFLIINLLILGLILNKVLFSYGLYYDKSADLLMGYSIFQELALVRYIDTVIPVLSAIYIIIIFYEDYNGHIYELLYVNSPYKNNKIIFIRWFLIFIFSVVASIFFTIILYNLTEFSGDIYSDSGIFAFNNSLISIILKSIPTLLFYTVMPMTIILKTRNIYVSIATLLIFSFIDVYGFLYIYPLGAMWNSNSYLVGKQFTENIMFNTEKFSKCFILNRLLLTVGSLIVLSYICKCSPKKSRN